jgi:hypothetical protein
MGRASKPHPGRAPFLSVRRENFEIVGKKCQSYWKSHRRESGDHEDCERSAGIEENEQPINYVGTAK